MTAALAAALVYVPRDDLGFAERRAENRDEIDTFEVASAVGERKQPFARGGVDRLAQVGSQFLGNRDAVLVTALRDVGPVRAPYE